MAGRTKKAEAGKTSRAEKVEAEKVEVTEKPMRPAQCRAYLRRTIAEEFPGIVDGFVKSAKQGSCQHVKLATELMKTPPRTRLRGRGKVEELLKKLEREELGKS